MRNVNLPQSTGLMGCVIDRQSKSKSELYTSNNIISLYLVTQPEREMYFIVWRLRGDIKFPILSVSKIDVFQTCTLPNLTDSKVVFFKT